MPPSLDELHATKPVSDQSDQWVFRSPWPRQLSNAAFERVVMTLIAICAFLPYFPINYLALALPARDLTGAIDRLIPFSPVWELVYVSIYFYIFVLVFYIRDPHLFRRTVLSFVVIQATCFVIFLAFPVGIERPSGLNPGDSFLDWGLALNYTLDQPRNLFPSLHLANAFMASLLLLRVQPRVGALAIGWAVLIGYSTMAARHHAFADVVAGIVVALLADRLIVAPAITGRRDRALLYPARYALAVIALYPVAVLLLYLLWRAGWQPFVWPPPT